MVFECVRAYREEKLKERQEAAAITQKLLDASAASGPKTGGKIVNAYGQEEVGISRREAKQSALRSMYAQSTEKVSTRRRFPPFLFACGVCARIYCVWVGGPTGRRMVALEWAMNACLVDVKWRLCCASAHLLTCCACRALTRNVSLTSGGASQAASRQKGFQQSLCPTVLQREQI